MTIVVVHGAWGGAWGWKEAVRLMRGRGWTVYAQSMTGIAERSHVRPEHVTLSTHIADNTGMLRYEELSNVLLVGHSYGGMVITGVADQEPGRIGGMVYLDAFLPKSGESLWDIVGTEMAELQRSSAEAFDGGHSVPLPPAILDTNREGPPPAILQKFTPQPTGTLSEKLVSVREQQTWPRRHYILCTKTTATFGKFAAEVRGQPGWEYSEFDAPHDVPRSHPQMTADRLIEIAEAWGIPKD